MAVSSCLRQFLGYDSRRLRFLYNSAVEPIFTYGCSVWASVLCTKAGVKKIRSFQRIICRVITRSFKAVPTESLILLSNLLPLDLRILEISSFGLFSQSPASFLPAHLAISSCSVSPTRAKATHWLVPVSLSLINFLHGESF